MWFSQSCLHPTHLYFLNVKVMRTNISLCHLWCIWDSINTGKNKLRMYCNELINLIFLSNAYLVSMIHFCYTCHTYSWKSFPKTYANRIIDLIRYHFFFHMKDFLCKLHVMKTSTFTFVFKDICCYKLIIMVRWRMGFSRCLSLSLGIEYILPYVAKETLWIWLS